MKRILPILLLGLVLAGIAVWWQGRVKVQYEISQISSFQECADAGYPIMESYPEQCRTPDGRNFVRVIDDEPEAPITPTDGIPVSTSTTSGGGTVIVPEDPVFCTADAMQCPDGSYVGRSGPNCQFVCPTPVKTGIQGKVYLGPVCPVVQNPPDPQCDDRLYETNLVLTTVDGNRVVKSFSSNAKGEFSISVVPGEYRISSAPGGPVMPSCGQSSVIKVSSNSYTKTEIHCDTGIR